MISLHTLRPSRRRIGVSVVSGMFGAAFASLSSIASAGSEPALNPSLISPEHWQQLAEVGSRTVREFFGVVWVGGDDGLAALENGQWRRWRVADGLPVIRISALDMDLTSRDLWIGTLGGGLVRFTAGRFDVFNQFNSGIAGDLVFGVAIVRGRVYAATNGGVSVFEPSSQCWDLLVPRSVNESQQVALNLFVEGEALLANMWPHGTFRWDFDAREWLPETRSRPVESSPIVSAPADVALVRVPQNPPAIAILGPGTRRIDLPGVRGTGRDRAGRQQPDIAAVHIAVDLSRATDATTDVQLWHPAPGYANYGWGLLEDDLVGYADRSELVGMVAHLDNRQRYTAASIEFMRIPAVNVAIEPLDCGERTSQSRWFFRCRRDQPQRHRALLEYVHRHGRDQWVVIQCDAEADTVLRMAWTKSFASRNGMRSVAYVSVADLSFDRESKFIDPQKSAVLFLWGDPGQAMGVLSKLAELRQDLLLAGGSELAGTEIQELAKKAGWSVVTLVSSESSPPCSEELQKNYDSRPMAHSISKIPDELACQTFDGADHLLTAVRSSPPRRAAVANSLLRMEQDIFGERHFEAHRGNVAVRIEVFRDGQWRYEEITPSVPTAGSNP